MLDIPNTVPPLGPFMPAHVPTSSSNDDVNFLATEPLPFPGMHTFTANIQPTSTAATSPKRASSASSQMSATENDKIVKRQRNNIAARKYRQKKIDRISELEDALNDMTKERDELRLELARQQAQTRALKDMMGNGK
jgi:hypothetical protein